MPDRPPPRPPTAPIPIASLTLGAGRLGLAPCPGGRDRAADLEADLDAIRDWGARAVLSLVGDDEIAALGVAGLGDGLARRGIAWHRLPLRDFGTPDDAAMDLWRRLGPCLHGVLDAGGRVLVHCRGGLGRSGTVAALMLIERGAEPAEAIAAVRAVRPGAVETEGQARWLAMQARARRG